MSRGVRVGVCVKICECVFEKIRQDKLIVGEMEDY